MALDVREAKSMARICSVLLSPVLVSLALFWCDVLDAKDNVHTHILLVGGLCMKGATQGEVQLLGRYMQMLHHQQEREKRKCIGGQGEHLGEGQESRARGASQEQGWLQPSWGCHRRVKTPGQVEIKRTSKDALDAFVLSRGCGVVVPGLHPA